MFGRFFCHALPPNVAIVGQCDIGKNTVLAARLHGVGIRFVGRARRDAEPTGLGIDGPRFSVRSGNDPSDVVAYRGHLAVLECVRRDEHGEIGFAAGAGEGGCNVTFFPVRRLNAEDEHVLGHPSLVAPDGRGNAQGETLFPQ